MHRNSYDSDNTTFSPQGRIHQVSPRLRLGGGREGDAVARADAVDEFE